MPVVDINGNRIHYDIQGEGPWLTLSSSLAADLSLWEGQMAALTPYFRVLRYDMRGHGRSTIAQDSCDFGDLTADVLGLWDALGIARSHFVGLSIGGMIGQHLALAAPERLDRLVLCSTSSGYGDKGSANREAVAKLWEQRIAQAQAGGMAAMVEGTLGRWFTEAYRLEEPEVMARIGAMIQSTSLGGYAACGRAVAAMDTTDRLGRITMPTLVLVGDEDAGTTPAMAESIAAAIPGARYENIPQASHLLNIEQADLFNVLLLAFLGTL